MKHARKDYNRIQDPAGLIPEDEPVFLIRGQDFVGPYVVDVWATSAQAAGADPRIVNSAREQAEAMRKWQSEHFSKIPDMPD
jgi:hypothetical protein